MILKRRTVFFNFFILVCLISISASAEEAEERAKEKKEESESERIVVLRAGEWEIDAGGQVRLRGDFGKNQNFTDFGFTPGHKEGQFLERTRLQASAENHALNLKAFVQGQWYGRWGGLDKRSACFGSYRLT